MSNTLLRNSVLSVALGSALAVGAVTEAGEPNAYQYDLNSNIRFVSNESSTSLLNMYQSKVVDDFNKALSIKNDAKSHEECAKVLMPYITEKTFSGSDRGMNLAISLSSKMGIDVDSIYGALVKGKQLIDERIQSKYQLYSENFHYQAPAGVDDLSGKNLVFAPVIRKHWASDGRRLENGFNNPVCENPKSLNEIQFVKEGKLNRAAAAQRAMKFYQEQGKDPLSIMLPDRKLESFHAKFGPSNQLNALIAPFFSVRSDKYDIQYSLDGLDSQAKEALRTAFDSDGIFNYDRGIDGAGYSLNKEQVSDIVAVYGPETILELQSLKPHFFDKGAIEYINTQILALNENVYGSSFNDSLNVKQMSTTASLSKAKEILRENEIGMQNSNSDSLGTVKVGNQEYALSDGLYKGGTVKLDYAVNGVAAKLVSDNVPMITDDLGRSIPLSKDDIEQLKKLTNSYPKEISQSLGRGNDMSDFKVQYSEAERDSFKNLSAAAMSNQNSVVETKTLHVPVVEINSLLRIPENRQVAMVAHKELENHMKANGEFRHNLRPNVDYRIDKITPNGDGTYNCDITYNVEKQQENIINQGVKATTMSTESLGKVQTDGTVKLGDLGVSLPPPVMEPKVMHLEGLKNNVQPDLAPQQAGELMTRVALVQADDTLKASGTNYNLSMDFSSVSNMKYNPVDKTFSCDVAYSAEKQQENVKSAVRDNEGLGKVQTEGLAAPVMEQKVMHLEGLKGDPRLSPDIPGADSFVKRQAIAKTSLELQNSGLKYNFDRNPNSVGNIKYNPDTKTFSCDVIYSVEKQQENVKATSMSTEGFGKVQTEGTIQPPPLDRPMVMDDTGKMHSMTNDELNVVKNAEAIQKSEKENPSVSSSGHSYFVSVDDEKHVGFEQTDYYVKCNDINEVSKLAQIAAKGELSRSGRLQEDSSFRTIGKPEYTENGYKITVEAQNVLEDKSVNDKSIERNVNDRTNGDKPKIVLRGHEKQERGNDSLCKSVENIKRENQKGRSSRSDDNCLE